jgi:hypothetical protein
MSELTAKDKFAAAALILRRVNADTSVTDTRAVLGPVTVEIVEDSLALHYDDPIIAAPFRALQVLACDCQPAKRPMVRLWANAREWLWDALEPDAVLLVACDFIEAATGTSRNDWSHELADQDLAELDLTPALETAFRIEAMKTLAERGVL